MPTALIFKPTLSLSVPLSCMYTHPYNVTLNRFLQYLHRSLRDVLLYGKASEAQLAQHHHQQSQLLQFQEQLRQFQQHHHKHRGYPHHLENDSYSAELASCPVSVPEELWRVIIQTYNHSQVLAIKVSLPAVTPCLPASLSSDDCTNVTLVSYLSRPSASESMSRAVPGMVKALVQ